ncbi:hypothetical protein GCM10011517_25450 [Actibacterium pelagium]|uniref:Uncharacterized protein n=1 Tax=Actibacterium pelagium TaxID=2029103 RepID=A0A917AJK3_9RHOB|nr:hypothetical protein GCM10011517_25450 [Actibacterium pelagium]
MWQGAGSMIVYRFAIGEVNPGLIAVTVNEHELGIEAENLQAHI